MAIITRMQNKSTLHYQFHENQLNCLRLHLGLRFTNSHVNNNNRMSIISSHKIGFVEVSSKKKNFYLHDHHQFKAAIGKSNSHKAHFFCRFFY